jgi:Ca-activated chloride channel family protein
MLDTGCWILDAGYWILDTRLSVLVTWFSFLGNEEQKFANNVDNENVPIKIVLASSIEHRASSIEHRASIRTFGYIPSLRIQNTPKLYNHETILKIFSIYLFPSRLIYKQKKEKTNQEVVMKIFKLIQAVLILLAVPNLGIYGQTMENVDEDKTLSPFFFVQSEDSDLDQMPLKRTSANVNIAGVIADVKVVQIYKNEGKSVLEAIYIFPASTRAAVYAMKMTIGERVINAKIKERKEARQEYEQAVSEGRTASLLEQQRPNVFQMNVGNILPGDEITVELHYTELLLSEDKTYEFMYPTVVGPRYSNKSENEAGTDKWVKNPYLHEGKDPNYDFDIDVHIAAGMPINDLFSPSHNLDVDYKSSDDAVIELASGEHKKGDRDFILKYRLNGDQIAPGLLLHRGDKENFFLMMLQPPKRIITKEIPYREYIFIVDVSGSMNGFPLDISKELLRNLIGNLQEVDRFNVLLFASGSSLMSEKSLPATEQNIKKAIRLIERERGGGGTELLPALKRALALPRGEGYSRSVVIVTDGYVHVEKEAFDLIRNNLGKANMFPFGIGSSVNRFLIEGMARAGMGESFVITRPDDAKKTATKFRKYIASPVYLF